MREKMNIRGSHMQLIDRKENHTLVICEIILNECFRIRGVKLMESVHGIFLSMPSSKRKDHEYHNIAFTITKDVREEIFQKIKKEYEYLLSLKQEIKKEDITVNIYPVEEPGNFCAYATINIKDMIAVNSIRIIDGIEGMFITMPSFKKGEEYISICSPITKEFGNCLKEVILEAYQKKMREYIMKGSDQSSQGKEETLNEPG